MHFNPAGLLFIGGGIYAFLVAHGVVSASKNRAANEAWRQKYGRLLKITSPIVVLFGLGELLGLFA
jgi:uncharacterized BrkB/YihY/UPF0761 family membrane protein